MIITICGSIEFSDKIIEIKEQLERMGHGVNIPCYTQKILDGETTLEAYRAKKEKDGGDTALRDAVPVDFIKRYWDLIHDSDAILVLNFAKKGIEGYIGGSTFMEMGFAYGHGKKIFCYYPLPDRGERMHYLDEIIDMKPLIIDGNLIKIQ